MAAISIGMPVYDGKLFLREALECLMQQTFGDFELTVSDDCSTDGSLDIVEAFAARDPRIVVIHQARNVGAAANHRVVLDAATAEYFLWFDQDDWVMPNFLERLYSVLTADPSKTLAVASFILKQGKFLTRPWVQIIVTWPHDPSEARRGQFPKLSRYSRVWRVIRLLRTSRPPWIYGLFRTAELRNALARTQDDFGHVRFMAKQTVLPFLLNDRVVGTNTTVFYKRIYKTEAQKALRLPRRKLLGERYHFAATHLLFCLRQLFESRLDFWEKLVCSPFVLAYSSRNGEKFRRLIRSTLAWPVRQVWRWASGKEL